MLSPFNFSLNFEPYPFIHRTPKYNFPSHLPPISAAPLSSFLTHSPPLMCSTQPPSGICFYEVCASFFRIRYAASQYFFIAHMLAAGFATCAAHCLSPYSAGNTFSLPLRQGSYAFHFSTRSHALTGGLPLSSCNAAPVRP